VAPLQSALGTNATVLRDRNFQLLLASNVAPVVGTALLSPVLDSLIEPFGTTTGDVGLLISVFSAPGVVVVPLAGMLADRYGRKPVIVAALVLFGATGTAITLTTDFRVALALRFLQGIGFAGVVPTLITSIGDFYRGAREATAQGLRFTVSGLSQAVFPLAAGALVTLAWQYPFLCYALALPIAVLVALYMDEPTGATPVADGGSERSYRRALADLVGRPRVAALVVARTLPVVVWIGFLTYNSIIVVRLLGETPVQAGLLTALGSHAFAGAASQAGRITELFRSRYRPLLVANVALATGFVVVLFAPTLAVAAVGIVLAGLGFGTTLSLYRAIITGLAPQSLRAGLVSVAEAGGRLTAALTPVAMGAVVTVLSPTFGVGSAVRVAGVGAAVVGGAGGVACLVVAHVSPLAPAETARD
jgi:MFS family permease